MEYLAASNYAPTPISMSTFRHKEHIVFLRIDTGYVSQSGYYFPVNETFREKNLEVSLELDGVRDRRETSGVVCGPN